MADEKLLFHYDFKKEYTIEKVNEIGATIDETIRTVVTTTDSNCKYVKKFGTPYQIKSVTDIDDPGTNLNFLIKTIDEEVIGGRLDGLAFNIVKEKLNTDTDDNTNSIDLDSNGNVHVIYYDDVLDGLYYLNNINNIWNKELVLSSTAINYSRIKVDSNDKIHIVLINESDEVIYLENTSGTWTSVTVDDSTVNTESDIDLDSNDYAHIVYKDSDNFKIRYAENTGGSFTKTEIGNCDSSVGTSIAVDSADKVHIAFSDNSDNLEYATNTTGSWVNTDVYTSGLVTEGVSIDTDSNNYAYISFYNGVTLPTPVQDLLYATNKTGSWVVSTIDSTNDVGRYSSINIDSADKVHISYNDLTNRNLKYATNTTGSFVISVLDTDNTDIVKYSNLKTDSSNRINIAYNSNEFRVIYSIPTIVLDDPKTVYLQIDGYGSGTLSTSINIDTDVDASGYSFIAPGESIIDDQQIKLYLSYSGSTYYDQNYKHGGARHTPTGVERLPYFKIQDAIDTVTPTFINVEVLDSEIYEEIITINDNNTNIQSSLGQTPTIKAPGCGARISREVENDGNNIDTIYVGKSGSDSTGDGTYQKPYFSLQYAHDNLNGRTNINIIDSLGYAEGLSVTNVITLEPIYGEVPIFTGGYQIHIITGGNGSTIIGLDLRFSTPEAILCYQAGSSNILDNSITNATIGIKYDSSSVSGDIKRNKIRNIYTGLLCNTGSNGASIENNIVGDCANGLFIAFTSTTSGISIKNNIIHDCSLYGIEQVGGNNATIENNTIYKCNVGIDYGSLPTGNTIRNNIIYNSTSYDLVDTSTAQTITYSCFITNNGFTEGTGNVKSDPLLSQVFTPYKLGISPISPVIRKDSNSKDIGTNLDLITITANNITINGFIIDGNDFFNYGIIDSTDTNYTGFISKYNDVINCTSSGIFLYDSDTDTDAQILNTKVYKNGSGISLFYGGNTLKNNLIYRNSQIGLYSNYLSTIIQSNVFFSNSEGIRFDENTAGTTIVNNIFDNNFEYGIYSAVIVVGTYNCHTDPILNVNFDDETNIIIDPLFINIEQDSEDFNLRSVEGGFKYESSLINRGIGGADIGAYIVDRELLSEQIKSYQLDYNPFMVERSLKLKGQTKFDNALGSLSTFGRSHKMIFNLQWNDDDLQTEKQLFTMRYLSQLSKTRENEKSDENVKVYFHLRPEEKELTGSSGIISGSKLNDSLLNLAENRYKGYHLAVKFESGSGMIIDADAKTGTVSGAEWTEDQWKGYYIYYNLNYHIIISNTSDTITVSDIYGVLIDGVINYSFEKYFKILKHSPNEFCLYDPNSELTNGTYAYYIDFVECIITNALFKPKQDSGFRETQYHQQTGIQITLEEK